MTVQMENLRLMNEGEAESDYRELYRELLDEHQKLLRKHNKVVNEYTIKKEDAQLARNLITEYSDSLSDLKRELADIKVQVELILGEPDEGPFSKLRKIESLFRGKKKKNKGGLSK